MAADHLDLAALAAAAPWPVDRTVAAGGRCHPALVSGWRQLVAADVANGVVADLHADGLDLQPDAHGRIAVAAWLRLHDHLAQRLSGGDRAAFGQLWLQEVGGRLPWLGRAGLRALGLTGAVRQLPGVWAAGFDLPAPQVQVHGGHVDATWRRHAVFAAPTYRWLIALQGALLAPVCGGWPGVRVAAAVAEEPFEITWISGQP